MIVQIAGTNGSGKSTVVRRILEMASSRAGDAIELPGVRGRTAVIGDYSGAPTGGCDGLKPDEAYRRIEEAACHRDHVLFEGIFVMNQTRSPPLVAALGHPFVVVLLTTPLGTCLSSINQRRAARTAGDLRNLRNAENNYVRANNYAARMRDAGARVVRVPREEAPGRVLEIFQECLN